MTKKIFILSLFILIFTLISCGQDQIITDMQTTDIPITDIPTTEIVTTQPISTEILTNEMGEYILEEGLVPKMIEDNYRVYYEIFLGSFSDSNQDGFGDIQGVINRLDYLNDGQASSGVSLGVTGLWLMPIMPSPSYHKYDTTNYLSIDPVYGNMDDFENLVSEANQRGIDIIIDLVLNHTSNQHPWFKNALNAYKEGDLDNPYLEYYVLVTEEEKLPNRTYHHFYGELYYEGNFSSSMPELDLDSLLVRQEIQQIIEFWFNKGIKGFRLDAVKYPYYEEHQKNIDFWNWFMDQVYMQRSDAYVVGEMWDSDENIYPYYEPFNNFDFGFSQLNGAVSMTVKNLETVNDYVRYLDRYKNNVLKVNPQAILQPFISNHDMNRAAGFLMVDEYAMHMAANLYILTYGTPFIYYGEEIGMLGSRSTENTDANRRLAMYWGDGDSVTNPIGSTWTVDRQINGSVQDQIGDPNSLYNHYKKLIMVRNAHPEIARGQYTLIDFSELITFGGFLSTYGDSTVGVFHNTGFGQVTIDLSQYTDYEFSQLSAYLGQAQASLDGQTLTIGPRTSVVLK
ncbi:alpha amylase [Hujiaoplasma nucleasis]|uniref:Alpha amylase n=1 Tax=Hujiaoplasma nucleasis TaxID=2725268 RepID=A0A7L6N3Q0_9MOLU|nr:alpha-amylase family glycosyl hydrolase [Hujiaoplasma nucleasis]QLY39685.1 alpha amylase [Hujiaoplasma nucleasis]